MCLNTQKLLAIQPGLSEKLNRKKILFRVDGHQAVGLGHLIRCKAIADNLLKRDKSTEIVFLSKLDEFTEKLINNKDYQLIRIINHEKEEDVLSEYLNHVHADILIIDNVFDYEPQYITALRKKIQVILFHYFRPACFYADKFILPSAHTAGNIINNAQWNLSDTQFFYGPEYIIINQEIQKVKKKREAFKPRKKKLNLVVTTGGSDPKAVLIKLVKWLSESAIENIDVCILKGQSFMHDLRLNQLIDKIPPNIRITTYNSEELILADIAVSTFGVSTYELMYLGIPVLSIGHAVPNAQGSNLIQKRFNSLIDLGLMDNLNRTDFFFELVRLIKSTELRNYLTESGKKIVDGKGLDRVIDAIYL
jgi:UDP-2,4-diacetamido-2,4,6-trideoxy-beta-L-altropyranose hydrolase